MARFGGTRATWIDLSTGINPTPYAPPALSDTAWTALPDSAAQARLEAAARAFWSVPDAAEVIAAPGASALIAQMPSLTTAQKVQIDGPTYNEHAAAFALAGKPVAKTAPAQVVVHPNNPDGRLWSASDLGGADLCVIDESFCDVTPAHSHIARAATPGTVVLKSFGKFWGLAGLRLGFAIAHPETFARGQGRLSERLGPWAVSGPALEIGAAALEDLAWAEATRASLLQEAARLDGLLAAKGATLVGGTSLFRLYDVGAAQAWQTALARNHVWSRIFPYSSRWLRLGLPPRTRWGQLETALEACP